MKTIKQINKNIYRRLLGEREFQIVRDARRKDERNRLRTNQRSKLQQILKDQKEEA